MAIVKISKSHTFLQQKLLYNILNQVAGAAREIQKIKI